MPIQTTTRLSDQASDSSSKLCQKRLQSQREMKADTAPLIPLQRNTSASRSESNLKKYFSQNESLKGNVETQYRYGRGHWSNDHAVSYVSMNFLYAPHTLWLLVITLMALYVGAFSNLTDSFYDNSIRALCAAVFVFLIIGSLVFPSGPFIRPHPTFWRLVFGVTVVYELFLVFLLFMNRSDARRVFTIFNPSLNQAPVEKPYAEHCELNLENVKGTIFDRFFVAHFVGWVLKSLMLRDTTICWTMSIAWEFIERSFFHMLPNFKECWWDAWILDVIVTNGLGIAVGSYLCRYFELKEYRWSDIHNISTVWGKLKRLSMQFTPESWIRVRWAATSSVKRYMVIQIIMWSFQLQELNAFFLKNILWIPSESNLNIARLVIWFLMGVPVMRQIYIFVTDPTCKRLGTQSWVCALVLLTELLIVFKFGQGLYAQPMDPIIKTQTIMVVSIYIIFSIFVIIRIHNPSLSFSHAELIKQYIPKMSRTNQSQLHEQDQAQNASASSKSKDLDSSSKSSAQDHDEVPSAQSSSFRKDNMRSA